MRRDGEVEMNWSYVLSGVLAVALLIYLIGALIRAEDL
jgi:K+-transporting ATPase KdpF subunit